MHAVVAAQTGGGITPFIQHEAWHQGFEHAPAPRGDKPYAPPGVVPADIKLVSRALRHTVQRRLRLPGILAGIGQGTMEFEPVRGGYVSLANGNQTPQPR